MKKTLTFIALYTPLLFACTQHTEKNTSLASLDWKDVKDTEFQLVRPISFMPEAKDAYHLPLNTQQWYLISSHAGCALLPVDIYAGGGPTYIQDVINHQKIAVLDTVAEHILCASKYAPEVENYTVLEVVCFKPGHSPKPSLSSGKQISLYTEIIGEEEK